MARSDPRGNARRRIVTLPDWVDWWLFSEATAEGLSISQLVQRLAIDEMARIDNENEALNVPS